MIYNVHYDKYVYTVSSQPVFAHTVCCLWNAFPSVCLNSFYLYMKIHSKQNVIYIFFYIYLIVLTKYMQSVKRSFYSQHHHWMKFLTTLCHHSQRLSQALNYHSYLFYVFFYYGTDCVALWLHAHILYSQMCFFQERQLFYFPSLLFLVKCLVYSRLTEISKIYSISSVIQYISWRKEKHFHSQIIQAVAIPKRWLLYCA